MKRAPLAMFVILLLAETGVARAGTILLVDFSSSAGFTIGSPTAYGYWGLAPLGGTTAISSGFVQGGSQSGDIFFGSWGENELSPPEGSTDWWVPVTITIDVPDLTRYIDLQLTVSLAASDETQGVLWEKSHRDSLIIWGTTGAATHEIDRFRPISGSSVEYGSRLYSGEFGTSLGVTFQDYVYDIKPNLHGMNSLTFGFASSDWPEKIGIDSIRITGTHVPDPGSTLLLFGMGLVGLRAWRK